MPTLEVTRDIPFSTQRAWDAFSDVGEIYRFHPVVERSPVHGDKRRGVGAKRVCHFYDGNHITEKVVHWHEGQSMEVEVTEGSMPVKSARARLSVEPRPEGSRVRMRLEYTPKWGVVGQVMDAVMMRRMFRRMAESILLGLETHLRTGAIIGRDGQPEQPPLAASA